MKTSFQKMLLVVSLLAGAQAQLFAQGTAFTYQGRLNDNGGAANGGYDLKFTVYDTNRPAGNLIAGPLTNSATAVSNGLFTVLLDFGAGIFTGPGCWLEIAVQTNGGTGFNTLTPRQLLTPTPYAIFASTASNVSGTVSAGQIAGGTIANSILPASPVFSGTVTANQISGNGANVTNVNAVLLNGKAATNFWQAAGNAGTSPAGGNFLGTTDIQPLVLKVNGQQAVRYEPTTDTPNVIGGFSGNSVAGGAVGATICGGGTAIGVQPNTIGGGGQYGTIAGGFRNAVLGYGGIVGGGAVNTNGGTFGGIGGGEFNTMMGAYSWIGGGYQNTVQMNGTYSTIGGGINNTILQALGNVTISGGEANTIGGDSATIAGGTFNAANGNYSVIGGGNGNSAAANYSVINGGYANGAGGLYSVIGGGYANSATTNYSIVGGGSGNSTLGTLATVGGGEANKIYANSHHAFIGGGQKNEIYQGAHAVIAGGSNNLAQTAGAAVGGGLNNQAGSLLFGGTAAAVAGGANNVAYGNFSSIAGGANNVITGDYSTVAGGSANYADGNYAFAAGCRAQAEHDGTFVWADSQNADFASGNVNQFLIRAGNGVGINTANPTGVLHIAVNGTVTNGTPALVLDNQTVNNGLGNLVNFVENGTLKGQIYEHTGLNGNGCLELRLHTANNNISNPIYSYLTIENGLVNLGADTTVGGNLTVGGDVTADNMIADEFVTTSDRNAKTNFTGISVENVLQKVLALPLTRWNFKKDNTAAQHLGPMAQDFRAAFGLGRDDKHIATVDEDGVALAAIQGLNQKLEADNAALRQSMADLKQLVQSLVAQSGPQK